MKVLIVRPSPNKMNVNTYNLQEIGLAKALVRKGCVCDVMYYCGNEKDHIEKIVFDENKSLNILWLHGKGILREGIYPSLKKYVPNYDIVQVGGYVGLTSCWLNRKYPEKIVNYQGPYYYKANQGDIKKAAVFDRLLLPLQKKKNMVVATKSILATNYIKDKGIENVTTIGVGLDLDNLLRDSESIEENEFIKEIKEIKNSTLFLYIGVLEERRNILFLLEVFQKVGKQIENSKLIIIGKGKQNYVAMCKEKLIELGLENDVIYREKLEQKYMPAIYQASDAFLLPTRYEIFGMVLLEAMYYGLPVFTTYNGGSSTLINNENGIIIENTDCNEWSKKIVKVLSDKKECDAIGEKAHRTVEKNYTWDALANKFLSVYEKRLRNTNE
ncbi:glycosyltransferase family 4 protein [Coprococcus comes]|uniref:glycosyltransferase family 4 protein n=1 Tax=Coprococcus comes TaxID=410072 RepID=UPI003F8CA863